jgi:AbrB family looped-hinge helix DNA binding protein
MDTILTIDSAGRIVLPKPLRDRHGLSSGSELQLRDDGAELHLRPVASDSPLREANGFLVYIGHDSAPSDTAVKQAREARLRRIAGR